MAHQVGKYIVVTGISKFAMDHEGHSIRGIWSIQEASPSVVHWTLIDAGSTEPMDQVAGAEAAALSIAIGRAHLLLGDHGIEPIEVRYPIPERG